MMRTLLALLPGVLSLSALAQNTDIQKQLILRDQQSADFALQVRQSQEALRVAPANRASLESRQISDRQRLDNLSAQQLLEVMRDLPEALRPRERQQREADRRPFMSPIVEVPVRVEPAPPPLQPMLKGNVDVIAAPR